MFTSSAHQRRAPGHHPDLCTAPLTALVASSHSRPMSQTDAYRAPRLMRAPMLRHGLGPHFSPPSSLDHAPAQPRTPALHGLCSALRLTTRPAMPPPRREPPSSHGFLLGAHGPKVSSPSLARTDPHGPGPRTRLFLPHPRNGPNGPDPTLGPAPLSLSPAAPLPVPGHPSTRSARPGPARTAHTLSSTHSLSLDRLWLPTPAFVICPPTACSSAHQRTAPGPHPSSCTAPLTALAASTHLRPKSQTNARVLSP